MNAMCMRNTFENGLDKNEKRKMKNEKEFFQFAILFFVIMRSASLTADGIQLLKLLNKLK